MTAHWQAIHETTLVVDGLDCSMPTEEYARKLRAARVGCMHLTVSAVNRRGNVYPFVRVYDLTDRSESSFRLCRRVAEIEQARQDGRIALILGAQNADPPGVEHGTLRAYFELGLRITGITYNKTNRYGGGCLEPHRGLTADGHALVEEIHRLGMLLDVGGHTGETCSLEAIAASAGRPVICSHTALTALNLNRRNTSDRVCEAIARSGGVIGVLAVNDFLARNAANASKPFTPVAPLEVMLDHIDHLKSLVGADHVALGPDFVEGVDMSLPQWPGPLWRADMISAGDTIDYVDRFQSIDQLPNVTTALLERGWSTAELRKLLGENWLRVYRAAWGA